MQLSLSRTKVMLGIKGMASISRIKRLPLAHDFLGFLGQILEQFFELLPFLKANSLKE